MQPGDTATASAQTGSAPAELRVGGPLGCALQAGPTEGANHFAPLASLAGTSPHDDGPAVRQSFRVCPVCLLSCRFSFGALCPCVVPTATLLVRGDTSRRAGRGPPMAMSAVGAGGRAEPLGPSSGRRGPMAGDTRLFSVQLNAAPGQGETSFQTNGDNEAGFRETSLNLGGLHACGPSEQAAWEVCRHRGEPVRSTCRRATERLVPAFRVAPRGHPGALPQCRYYPRLGGGGGGAFWPGGPRRSEDAPSEGVEEAGGLCGPGGKGNGQRPSDKGSVLRKANTFPGSAREEGSVGLPSHACVG